MYVCMYSRAPGRIQVAAGGNMSLFIAVVFCLSTSTVDCILSTYIGSFHRVRLLLESFARKMYSTTKFATTVLSKCVCGASE